MLPGTISICVGILISELSDQRRNILQGTHNSLPVIIMMWGNRITGRSVLPGILAEFVLVFVFVFGPSPESVTPWKKVLAGLTDLTQLAVS